MTTLVIRHEGTGEAPEFKVERIDAKGSKSTPKAVAVRSPVGYPVEGRPNSDLMAELRWYLESFLDYPFEPETDHAERVQAALRRWGEETFTALFSDMNAAGWFLDANKRGLDTLHLQVASDDPRVLAWPWEALRAPQVGDLAATCQIERRLNSVLDPPEAPEGLPTDRVNILLVTARPYQGDVRYRSLSRPLVELIEEQKLPARVTVLRPPTFDALREHLKQRPSHYHIVHFDGHGAYRREAVGPIGPHALRGPVGRLVFEKEDGGADPIEASKLSVLLREHKIPAVVLNACQSGMVDHAADTPFASVAAGLLQAGIRSVVAMAYSLYVSGGQQFLPDFYRRLFETGSFAQATRAGRQQMLKEDGRVCARGTYPLQDWLVPVLYQQDPPDLAFVSRPRKPKKAPAKARGKAKEAAPTALSLPAEVADTENPYGFVGRDSALLALERALRRDPAAVLVHGLGGVGKTTLARGFIKWLHDTDGLGLGCLWFGFQDIRSAEYVINRMGEPFSGPNFAAVPTDQKLDALVSVLREHFVLLVWDNFESARGIEGTPVGANLSADDQGLLRTLVQKLRGGKSKVLITSRSDEEWLGGPAHRAKVDLGGLDGEERWEFCEAVLRDLGKPISRQDADLVALMDLLGGHPLAMRVVLPRLEGRRAADLIAALRTNLAALGPGDEAQQKLFATLRFAEQSLPTDLRPLLVPLALHEHFIDGNLLEFMAKEAEPGLTRSTVDRFLATLAGAGLVCDRGQAIFEIHPALTGFLRSRPSTTATNAPSDNWVRAFVSVMGRLADDLSPRGLHEQRKPYHIQEANFYQALFEAERLGMADFAAALTQSFSSFYEHAGNYAAAENSLFRFAELCRQHNMRQFESIAYHQLGIIAERRRNFDVAERWCLRALEIKEQIGDRRGVSSSYLQLGIIAEERNDFDAAEQFCVKALAIKEEIDDELGKAMVFHQLGIINQLREDAESAERWYAKASEIAERLGDELGAAATYDQLGRVALVRRDLDTAEEWYSRARGIKERLGDEIGAAITYHQLGIVNQERGDLDGAERWYLKSLEVRERIGDDLSAAGTYHQMGRAAELRGDFNAAERWCLKAMLIWERCGDTHRGSITQQMLDDLRGSRRLNLED